MIRDGMTVRQAAEEWVREMDAVQHGMIEKLVELDPDDWREVTKPSLCDRVYVYEVPAGCTNMGEIVKRGEDGKWLVLLDSQETISCEEEDFEVERYTILPMWGTMWSFRDSADNWWLEEDEGIQSMSECGFRVYESEEFGYFFGIDGAGYDFYESHWLPLYRARGLRWHDPATESKGGELR